MNVLLPLLLCRIRFRTRFHTRYRTRFRGRFRYEKIMKTICFLYDLTVFQPIPKSHIFTLHFCSPYVANLKNPRFLRHTQGISHQSQFAVNPYVTLPDKSYLQKPRISAEFRLYIKVKKRQFLQKTSSNIRTSPYVTTNNFLKTAENRHRRPCVC